jgi:hypothetical protein
LFIDNEPNKAFQNSKCNGLFVKGHKLSENKVQWLDLAPHLWLTLVGLLLARTTGVHYEVIQVFKALVDFFVKIFSSCNILKMIMGRKALFNFL